MKQAVFLGNRIMFEDHGTLQYKCNFFYFSFCMFVFIYIEISTELYNPEATTWRPTENSILYSLTRPAITYSKLTKEALE